MKSTIKIDFGHSVENQMGPVINITLAKNSDDVRDRLLRQFFEELGHESYWIRVQHGFNGKKDKKLVLFPVKPTELKDASDQMIRMIEHQAKIDAI